MKSTMQDAQLTIGSLMKHGTTVHADSEVVTATADGTRSRSYAELGRRAAQLAHGLRSLGITGDQRVATFQWNNVEHLEAYLAVPSMGAVLHTLNIRLFPEQLVYIANHAEDQVVIVDDSLVPLLAAQLPQLATVTHVLVAGPDAAGADLDVAALVRARRSCSTRTCWPGSPRSSTGPRWTSTTPPRCATRAAPPATPRGSSTATAPPGCTPWPSAPATSAASTGTTGSCRSCRCSTPTRGDWRTPR